MKFSGLVCLDMKNICGKNLSPCHLYT